MPTLKPKGVCDFCPGACNADMRGAKAYDCMDFRMSSGFMSEGAWAACPACAALVDAAQWGPLIDRMTEGQVERFVSMGFRRTIVNLMSPQMREACLHNVEGFRRYRAVPQ